MIKWFLDSQILVVLIGRQRKLIGLTLLLTLQMRFESTTNMNSLGLIRQMRRVLMKIDM